jgi:ATP-dependent DNA helicase RecG
MASENTTTEYKSILKIRNRDGSVNNDGFKDLATTCVSFANKEGGIITIGFEDKTKAPEIGQKITQEELNKAVRKLNSLCYNVGISNSEVLTHSNGGNYFELTIYPSLQTIATTSDGKVFIRVAEESMPMRSEDLTRLAAEKNAFQWELQVRKLDLIDENIKNLEEFTKDIRKSDRVKPHIKGMTDKEIGEHYHLTDFGKLTNLGVLWLGTASQRSRLSFPITVQYIVYDENEQKIRKESWHDNTLNPKELILDIERQAVELTYFHEFPQGLFRNKIRHYDEKLIRELLVNAIAHKHYTISGDIFIEVYSDHVEFINPGGLPLGVTPNNILHTRMRRNPYLINILHDLQLMEGEGTGYDLIYAIDSRDSKPFPEIISDFNYLKVSQSSKILDEEAVLLLDFIAQQYTLTQREFTVLGIIARYKKIGSPKLSKELQLTEDDRLRNYVSRLIEQKILLTRNHGKGTEYLINPVLITNSKINIKTTLKLIEPHRLKALIEEDVKINPKSLISEIQARLPDVPEEDITKITRKMAKDGVLNYEGGRTYRKYSLAEKRRNEEENERRK